MSVPNKGKQGSNTGDPLSLFYLRTCVNADQTSNPETLLDSYFEAAPHIQPADFGVFTKAIARLYEAYDPNSLELNLVSAVARSVGNNFPKRRMGAADRLRKY